MGPRTAIAVIGVTWAVPGRQSSGRPQPDAFDDGSVADIALQKAEVGMGKIREQRFAAEEKIVHDGHMISALEQHAGEQRPDVSRTTGDKNSLRGSGG